MPPDRTLLGPAELSGFLARHPDWKERDKVLTRTFELASFAAGIRLVGRVAEAADAADHHPDIDIRYRKVTFALTTHDAGGLTTRDVRLAEEIDRLAQA